MENYESSSVVATCIGGFLVLLILWKKFGSGKKLRLPPGPPGWPVLGHLLTLGKMPHRSLMEMSQKYGPLMSVRLGTAPAVVISSPEMARIFLRTQDHVFASRPRTVNGEVFMYNFQDLAFSPSNVSWRTLRRLANEEIFSNKQLEHLKAFRNEEVLAAVERLLGTGREGNLVDITSNINRLSFDHICRICFNKRYFGCKTASLDLKGEPRDLHSLLVEWATISGSFFVGEYIPCLRKLDLGGFEAQLLRLRHVIEKFLNPIIEEHRHKQEEEAKDFLDALLSVQCEKDGNGIPDEQIKAFLQDIMIGGTDTAAAAMIWALAEIMRHPEITQKIVNELDLVVGKHRLVDESDLVQLKYLEATVKETLRMYPSGPLGAPHEAMENTQVAGYDIPKGTRVLVNIYSLGRDPNVWTDPNTFNPERFVDSPIDLRGHHFELLPFSSGRRQCPGMDMALRVLELGLAQILHTCVLSVPLGMEVDVEEGVGITLPKAHTLQLLVSPRLRPEVYGQHGLKF